MWMTGTSWSTARPKHRLLHHFATDNDFQVCGSTRLGNFSTSSSWSWWLRRKKPRSLSFRCKTFQGPRWVFLHQPPPSTWIFGVTQLQFLSAQHLKQSNHSRGHPRQTISFCPPPPLLATSSWTAVKRSSLPRLPATSRQITLVGPKNFMQTCNSSSVIDHLWELGPIRFWRLELLYMDYQVPKNAEYLKDNFLVCHCQSFSSEGREDSSDFEFTMPNCKMQFQQTSQGWLSATV